MANNPPTTLDKFFQVIVQVATQFPYLPQRPILNFASGFTVQDNTVNNSTDVAVNTSVTLPVRLNAASSSLQLTTAMIGATILLDTSGGSFVALLPPSPTDGWRFHFKDPNGSWGTTAAQVSDAHPRNIEHRIAKGTWPSSTISSNVKGDDFWLEYDLTNNRWHCSG
jgi:hypothetical protein